MHKIPEYPELDLAVGSLFTHNNVMFLHKNSFYLKYTSAFSNVSHIVAYGQYNRIEIKYRFNMKVFPDLFNTVYRQL